MSDAEDQAIHDALEAKAVRVPPLYVVETQSGLAAFPDRPAQFVWQLTAVDGAYDGKIVHLPLLFDFDFAVTCGIVTEEECEELKAKAAEQTPTTEGK